MGSVGVGSLFAQLVFVFLLLYAWVSDELGPTAIALLATAWVAGTWLFGSSALFSPALAILDVVLVLVIFKGDIRRP